ncbi:reverse transcriptase domain-containing protein [Artemisia annua]|uniref:Reverse transcriptase domain-containing protein n=1 Tax=Artemisia annua TaxID=35608 RepID=A0A2U1KSF6_ARTAN|nr:reverse transcriptase domain-containing protein [Artemisia annua]
MAEDDPITSVPVLGDGPNGPEPVVNLAGSDDPLMSIHNQSQPEPDLGDPVMHFVGQKEMEENISNNRQPRRVVKPKPENDTTFYNEPFTFKEIEENVRDLVASPFSKRIRDYEMPDGLKVPTNLRMYDGLSDPDDHLTVFMGTMDVHKLPEPAWCHFFHITLYGAVRFWYDNLAPGSINGFDQLRSKFRANFLQQRRFQKTQAGILGIRQRPEESLKDYLARSAKKRRIFKDLIVRPPLSLEDLYTQANNFIRAEEANNKNRLREAKRGAPDNRSNATYKDFYKKSRDKYIPRSGTRHVKRNTHQRGLFTPLVKTPAEIYATSEGRAILRPPAKMYTPPHRRDKTRYCEFHGDHGHDTNSCIDLRKEIEACVRNGRLSHLAKGAKAQNNSQTSGPSGCSNSLIPRQNHEPQTREITFSAHDPIPARCNGDDPLVIKADVGGAMIHHIYVDGGSSAEILYDHCFQQLSGALKATLQPPTTPLIGFAGQPLWPLGVITLPLTMYDNNGGGSKTIVVDFLVVQAPSPYNAILGPPGMKKLGAIASTVHALLKFPI